MSKIFRWTSIVSLAGILFGFDTVVISGADKALQVLWSSTDFFHGFVVMGTALWGTVLGALMGGYPTRIWGRKKCLIMIGLLYLVSAIGSALAMEPISFALFRFIGGLGVGASTIAAPAYISEIAPTHHRGRLVAMYQLSIVLGVLSAMFSNYLLKDMGAEPWRWMIGAEAVPAILYFFLVFTIPNSPRWLVYKGYDSKADALIKKYQLDLNVEELKGKIQAKLSADSLFSKKYRKAVLLVFFIALFNQFSGINAILYYAPRIFESAGLDRGSALLGGVWIGIVNLLFTLLGMALIDRYGRKQLLYIGSIGYIVSLSGVSLAFLNEWEGSLVLGFLMMFIASHAIGQGTVIWVFIAEVFPTHIRASGQAFGSFVHWILAAIIPSSIPLLFNSVGPSRVFLIFALFMVVQLIWVFLRMPETKGRSLEELSDSLTEN